MACVNGTPTPILHPVTHGFVIIISYTLRECSAHPFTPHHHQSQPQHSPPNHNPHTPQTPLNNSPAGFHAPDNGNAAPTQTATLNHGTTI